MRHYYVLSTVPAQLRASCWEGEKFRERQQLRHTRQEEEPLHLTSGIVRA